MALFAAMTLVGFQEGQIPFAHLINAVFGTEVHHFGWTMPTFLAILFALGMMLLFAFLVERLILKHLVNQEPIILFMATIGLAYFMEGFGDLMWGSNVKRLDVGIPQGGNFWIEENTAFLGGEDFLRLLSRYAGYLRNSYSCCVSYLTGFVFTIHQNRSGFAGSCR
ncbi:MAG: hypothetical protein CM15mP100_0640 [Alphaproteobacteria bacterium]|nr:MAG: hypothetical protein CM15mP100_0640 [Alphaproteobacteria bacterium]